jgi:hypothetical protein
MKIELTPQIKARRGGDVCVGNVYVNASGRMHYKIVINVLEKIGGKPYKNVAILKVSPTGDIIGAGMEPLPYIRDHHDLVGTVNNMPTLSVEWLT